MDGFSVNNATCLCEEHFTLADIKRNPHHWRLVPGAEPCLNLPTTDNIVPSATSKSKARKPPTPRHAILPPTLSMDVTEESSSIGDEMDLDLDHTFEEEEEPSTFTISTQTDFSFINSPTYLPIDSDEMKNDIMHSFARMTISITNADLSAKIAKLETQMEQLESQLAKVRSSLFSIEKLKSDYSATKFYTGFPNFSTLLATFEYFEPNVQQMQYWRGNKFFHSSDPHQSKSSRGPKHSLTHFEQFILVLMRLKVGLFIDDLANRFVPSSMKAQSQTWSEYKHHNTWKALIGISPSGLITFVSKLWSGKVSDKEITLKSGVLALLEDGDNLMADRGFDIQDILPPGVTLNIPPFKGTRAQLTAKETEETACIASVRIHVERAIGRVAE
eukprot:gene11612-biopygen9279